MRENSRLEHILDGTVIDKMGGVTSKFLKPFRTFNIENRAQKVIEKKPVPAPSYPSIEKQKQVADQSNCNLQNLSTNENNSQFKTLTDQSYLLLYCFS